LVCLFCKFKVEKKGDMAIKPILNESELLAKIAEGDQRAFSEVFHWYYAPLGQAIIKITESQTLTQEIVQDSFVKIWLKREDLTTIDNFSNYLFIVCRNHAFTTIKKLAKDRKLQPAIERHLQWESELADLENPSDDYRNLLEQAVAKLPTQQQNIYKLSRYQHLKYEEIAKKLGLSPETVKTQIYNAVKFIRKDLATNISPSILLILTTALTLNS